MKNYLDVLKAVRLFKGIEEADLQPLLSCLCAKVIPYEKGQTVFSSGESIEKFGIVLSGQTWELCPFSSEGGRAKVDAGTLRGVNYLDRNVKIVLRASAIIRLLFLMAEAVGGYMSLIRVQQLQQELEHLRIQVEQLNACMDENLDDIAALCASVNETQQRLQEIFQGENPLEKLLPG